MAECLPGMNKALDLNLGKGGGLGKTTSVEIHGQQSLHSLSIHMYLYTNIYISCKWVVSGDTLTLVVAYNICNRCFKYCGSVSSKQKRRTLLYYYKCFQYFSLKIKNLMRKMSTY